MRYDRDFVTNARVVSADELAKVIGVRSLFAPEHSGFELPPWMWCAMFLGYGTFFAGLIGATAGEARAALAITICVLYTLMFFGTAWILANLDGRRVGAFSKAGGKLRTCTGPMDVGSVAGQVLAIPGALALFGVAIAVIRASVM